MTPDFINALFELFGAFVSMLSVWALWKHKQVKGVSLWPSVFFTSWGVWNLFYYTGLGQPLSVCAGAVMLAVNLVWLTLALHYRRR